MKTWVLLVLVLVLSAFLAYAINMYIYSEGEELSDEDLMRLPSIYNNTSAPLGEWKVEVVG